MGKRMIIDFHFRGEQDILEKNHPQLREQALKMLGPVLYYDLTATCGKPLPKSSPYYKQLMQHYEKIEE